jgi:hypothetical protein
MPTPKNKKKKKGSTAPVFNEICYLASSNPIPARCLETRLHIYAEAWLGYEDYAKYYYKHIYKKSKKEITALGAFQNFENLLRGISNELSKAENKNRMIGDLIILTHGVEHYIIGSRQTETVKIKFPLLSLTNPDKTDRSLPIWWNEIDEQFDAQEVNKLLNPSSDYYKYVDGKGVDGRDKKDGLIAVVTKIICDHMDGETHIWLSGCNIGKNRDLMRAMRKLFGDRPVIYGFSRRHFIYYYYKDDNIENCTSCGEILKGRGERNGISPWTENGLKFVEHEP